MNVTLQILTIFGSVAILLVLMMIVRRLAKSNGLNAEVQRKLVHIGTGLYALTFPWLFPDRWPVYVLIGVTLIVMLILRLPTVAKTGLGSTLHGVQRQSYGDILLAISIGLSFFWAGQDVYLYVLPIAILTLADAAAALAGSSYGRRIFVVEDGIKSIEGSAVFFIVALLVSIICLMLLTPFEPLNIILISVMIAGFGTLVEADSWRGYDNLFLPLGLLVFLLNHGDKDLLVLASLSGLFVASLLAFRLISPALGLTRHAARVYVTTVFLIFAATAFQNTIIPILVLVAHAFSRHTNPSKERYPDLDVVAAIVLVSAGWLTIGFATDWNAVSFYGITAMGMVMGFSALGLVPFNMVRRAFGLAVIAVILIGIRHWIVFSNPKYVDWNGEMWSAVYAILCITTLIPSLFSNMFTRARVSKITALSLVVPLPVYLLSIDISHLVS